MVKVLAVNNYPTLERFERLRKGLEDNGADVAGINWSESSAQKFNGFGGVVLRGSPDMTSEKRTQQKFAGEMDAIRDASVPLLGVCFGHQLMAVAFGTPVIKDRENVLRFVRTNVIDGQGLFAGLPRSVMLLESRREVLSGLPDGFDLLARSETSAIAAMKHRTRPIYGVQSHPERYSKENPEGKRVLGNFVGLLK
jgi:GMP synthase-like glutamine amidotransferase